MRPQSALPAAGWFGHERFHICKIQSGFPNHEWTRIDTNARACEENETWNNEDTRRQSFV
jgi:hypothetical protein